jgi:hypothetical protein
LTTQPSPPSIKIISKTRQPQQPPIVATKPVATTNKGFFEELLASPSRASKAMAQSSPLLSVASSFPSASTPWTSAAGRNDKEMSKQIDQQEQSAARTFFETAFASSKMPEQASAASSIITSTSIGMSSEISMQNSDKMDIDKQKKRKRVTFAPDNELRHVRIFEVEEMDDASKVSFDNAIKVLCWN